MLGIQVSQKYQGIQLLRARDGGCAVGLAPQKRQARKGRVRPRKVHRFVVRLEVWKQRVARLPPEPERPHDERHAVALERLLDLRELRGGVVAGDEELEARGI